MPVSQRSQAQKHLALVAACLLLAAYLPAWHKTWFVAESGHFGGGATLEIFLLLGLYRQWRPALGILYGLLALSLLVAGSIICFNLAAGGPVLGFFLVSSLYLLAGLLLYRSSALHKYLKSKPTAETAYHKLLKNNSI